jgi:hypothetical protein
MPGLFNDNGPDYEVCGHVKQAIVLEKNYKEILLQGDEINLRIKLWRDAIDICKSSYKRMLLTPNQ